jgi:predicted lipoprotein with Yx(FWY)xxD motif
VNRRILIPLAVVAVVAVAVVIAVAGGSSDSGNSHNATAATPSTSTSTASISTRKGEHGTYLVDSQGRTLYLFEADKPNKSNCTGGCMSIWPAFNAGSKPPVAKGGAVAGKVGMTAAGQVVTYNGHPLYTYAGDQKPGDTSGQGLDDFGAKWYMVSPAGSKIDDD